MVTRNRRFKNYLLQPFLQVKLGLYSILLTLVFLVVFTSVLVAGLQRLFELILELTDLREEVMTLIQDEIVGMRFELIVILLIYFSATVVLSVLYTHRLIGPTIAFRRHIQSLSEGLYNSRVSLRRQDAFVEVAEDLNHLAEVLEKKG